MKKESWNSQFRKKRFYENQVLKREKKRQEAMEANAFSKNTNPKSIAVLLDLEETCDFISEEKVILFIKKLENLRRKFKADVATISISTHYRDFTKIEEILEVFAPYVTNTVKIGYSFFYGGMYDYENQIALPCYGSNLDKVKTFSYYYLNEAEWNNQWFALIDDGMGEDTYKQFQESHPMLLGRPSQEEEELVYNNFMSVASTTRGFDGVLGIMDCYIERTKNKTVKQILEAQENMMRHLSSYELTNKIRNKEYAFLLKYFKEGYADREDYGHVLKWISFIYIEQNLERKELLVLKELVLLLESQCIDKKENKQKIKDLLFELEKRQV